MSSRERWTVYPLLFLSLGLAMRAAMLPPTQVPALEAGLLEADKLVCGQIVVSDDEGRILVHIGRVKGGAGGRIEVNDRDGNERISLGMRPDSPDAALEFFDLEGNPVTAPGQDAAENLAPMAEDTTPTVPPTGAAPRPR